MNILQEKYFKEVVPALKKSFDYSSVMQVPKLVSVSLNMGVGDAIHNKDEVIKAAELLGLISGQKPVITLARKSIAGFKIREGWPIGCKVTLRRERMYDFMQRLIAIYLPRVRDFRGVPLRVMDGQGNCSVGISDLSVCPEVPYEKVEKNRGFDISIKTSAAQDAEGELLLRLLGFPFRG